MIQDLVLSRLEIVLDKVLLLLCHLLWLCQKNNVRFRVILFFHHHSRILCFFFQSTRREVLPWFVVNNTPWTPCTHVYLNIHFLLIWRIIQIDDFLSTFWCLLFCNTLRVRKVRWTICFLSCFANLRRSWNFNFFGSINWWSFISILLCLQLKKFLTLLIPQFR